MILAGIDFETTSLDIPTLGIAEVGFVLWDSDFKGPLAVRGFLVDPGDVVWAEDARKANGLSPELCRKHGTTDIAAIKAVLAIVEKADAVVAHNAESFDRTVLTRWAARYDKTVPEKPWIDTSTDLALDAKGSSRLKYMAADHGLLNPFGHRAVFDVVTMLMVLAKHNLEDVLATARSPQIMVRGTMSFDDRQQAKDRKYHSS